MDSLPDQPKDATPLPPARLGRSLRFGVRAAWDALGMVCVSSFVLFLAASAPLVVLSQAGRLAWAPGRAILAVGAVASWLLIVPPVYAGICFMANQALACEETSWLDMWRGCGRLYGRAVLLGLIDAGVAGLLCGNVLFYLTRGSFGLVLVAVVFVYLLAIWAMNVLYHAPLLVAGEVGVLRAEAGGRSGVRAALRNGLVMTVSAPGFTLGLLLVIVAVGVPVAASGVGMALLLGGTSAFLVTRATRDQLARFGVLIPPPDPDSPVVDDGWHV